jgi:hypothetical protein
MSVEALRGHLNVQTEEVHRNKTMRKIAERMRQRMLGNADFKSDGMPDEMMDLQVGAGKPLLSMHQFVRNGPTTND